MSNLLAVALMLALGSKSSATADCVPYGDLGTLHHRSAEVVRYIADIGSHDLISSSGERLTNYRDVLQQDRANVHRFDRRDPADGVDEFFTSAERRELFQNMNAVTWCYEPLETLSERIVSGKVLGFLEVTIFESVVDPGNYFIHIATVG